MADAKPWIGYLHMRARVPEARFWSIPSDDVFGRLAAVAKDASAFADALSSALDARQIDLVRLMDAAPAPELQGPELSAALKAVDGQSPTLVGRVVVAQAGQAAHLAETTREALPEDDTLWALLDGVQWPGLPEALEASGLPHLCLNASQDAEARAAAPWIVRLDPGSALRAAVLSKAPDAHIGILFRSRYKAQALRAHFRRFTMVPTPDTPGENVYFRFFDPRVMLDLTDALDPDTMAFLMQPLEAIYVPLSPYCLLPDGAVAAVPLSVFDPVESAAGRIIEITPGRGHVRPGGFTLSDMEFAGLKQRMKKRAQRALARRMHDEHEGIDIAICRAVSQAAPAAAERYGMTSVKQVNIMARAMVRHGPKFWEKDAQARAILERRDIRPWQKKNMLVDWMIDRSMAAAG